MKSPFAPFAKGGWGDFDATTLFDSNARVQRVGRESGEIVFSVAGLSPATEKYDPLRSQRLCGDTPSRRAGPGFYGHAVL
jgi:hypothetical protein